MGKVVLIDAYNIIYRAYHGGSKELKNAEGFPTGAMYTALRMIRKLRTNDIEFALIVFDGGGNFREELSEEYKANRKPMPDDLKLQMEPIKEALEYFGWPMMQADGVEADDVIATLAVRAANAGFPVEIISGDKDFRQLVNDKIKIIDTMYDTVYDRDTVHEKMGVYPEQVRLYLALMGDGVDNVQGIAKCGKKTAAELCNKYLTYENLVANAGEVKGIVGENLRTAIQSGSFEKDYTLVGVKLDVDVQISKKLLSLKQPDNAKIYDFAAKYNFKSWMAPESDIKKINHK